MKKPLPLIGPTFTEDQVEKPIRALCLQYWKIENINDPPYYQFVYKVDELAQKKGLKNKSAVIDLVKRHCKVIVPCQDCLKRLEIHLRSDFDKCFDFSAPAAKEQIPIPRCSDCLQLLRRLPITPLQAWKKVPPAGTVVQASIVQEEYEQSDVWPIDANGELKGVYKQTKHLVSKDRLKRALYRNLQDRYPLVVPNVALSSIIPLEMVQHLLTEASHSYTKYNFMASRLHMAVCSENFKVVFVIDYSSFRQEMSAQQAFKRHMLALAGIPYLYLPQDEALLVDHEKWRALINQIDRLDPD